MEVVIRRQKVGFNTWVLRCGLCNSVLSFVRVPIYPDVPACSLESALRDAKRHLIARHGISSVEIRLEDWPSL